MIPQTSTFTIFEMADSGNFLYGGSILLKGGAKHVGAEFCQTGFFRQKAPVILKALCPLRPWSISLGSGTKCLPQRVFVIWVV